MSTLYCKEDLLRRLPAGDGGDATAPTLARLGDWTAAFVALPPLRLVLAVSDHARLPLLMAADPFDEVPVRLPRELYRLLLDIRFPPELARLEREALQPLLPVSAGDRTAVAWLEHYESLLREAWDQGMSGRSPGEMSLFLATQPSELLEGATPAQAARRRFQLLPDQTSATGL